MATRLTVVTAGLILGLLSTAAHASYLVTFSQTLKGVEVTGNGEFNTSLLSDEDSAPALAGVFSGVSAFGFAPLPQGSASGELYTGFFTSSAGDFGTGGPIAATTSQGDISAFAYGAGLFGSSLVVLPTTYTSGSALSSQMLFAGATFASLGLTPGAYTYTYGQNFDLELAFRKDVASDFAPIFSTDFIQVNVGTVPLPASAPLFGAALVALGMVGYGLKRNGKATA